LHEELKKRKPPTPTTEALLIVGRSDMLTDAGMLLSIGVSLSIAVSMSSVEQPAGVLSG
jgi:hypothetical protein